ncbi:MAG TPA: VWA domain-containing protein [Thermoanaerobaculia bacterium]|nr:VWA domain-containing protein [Thermoanaerobaculia bacterium]
MTPLRSLLSLLVLAATPLAAQEPFQERVDVDLVLVDVTVTDSRGNQILGLGKDDFVLREDGVEQPIESVDYFTSRTLLTERESDAPFQVDRVRQQRWFILFFHELTDPSAIPGYLGELMRARKAAADLIRNELQPQDRVAIAGYDARLKIYADFTDDPKILERGLGDMMRFSNGLTEAPAYAGEVSIMREIDVKQMINRTGRIYDALEVLAEALRPIAARKVMAMFSPGIGEISSFSPQLPANEEIYYRPMIQALNGSNVTVHGIAMIREAGVYAPEQTLARVASETGGEFYKNFVSFQTPLGRIENQSSGYYLLTYRIRKPEGESGYQRIEVSLKNPDFRVHAREGYAY